MDAQEVKEALEALQRWAAEPRALEGASLPEQGEYFYFKNFKGFKTQIDGFLGRIQSALTALPGAPPAPAELFADVHDAGDWVSHLLEDALERVDDALADARAPTPAAAPADAATPASAPRATPAAVTGATAAGAAGGRGGRGTGGFVSYMDSRLAAKPQSAFEDAVDNSNTPFRPKLEALAGFLGLTAAEAAGLGAGGAGAGPAPHPLGPWLEALRYPGWQLALPPPAPTPPRGFEQTPYTFVDTLPALRAAAERLAAAKEIAVDLEAHNYRSFQGFCCLMQLSTRSEDMIIDALSLRSHMGPLLAPVFADPEIVKVLHGADGDVVWLQRDFGIYVANLFDTGQAARVLELPSHGLAYLLDHFCGFKADKRFQLADWRVRPLTAEMEHYARSDTHSLLYVYDRLRQLLAERPDAAVPPPLRVDLPAALAQDLAAAARCAAASAAAGAGGAGDGGAAAAPTLALATVLERSRRVCLLRYEKELLNETSFMQLYERCGAKLDDVQLSAFAALYAWRDGVARGEDESTGYVLSRAQLIRLAEAKPTSISQILRLVGRGAPLVSRRAGEVLRALQAAASPQQRAQVAAAAELRRSAWRALLPGAEAAAAAPAAVAAAAEVAEQQEAAAAAAGTEAGVEGAGKGAAGAGGAAPAAPPSVQQQQQQQHAPVASVAGAMAVGRPALQPKALQPLATASSGMLAGAGTATATAAPVVQLSREAVVLQPRAVKPLAQNGSSMLGGSSGILGGPRPAATQAAAAGAPAAAAPAAAPAEAAALGASAYAPRPLLQQQASAFGALLSGRGASTAGAAPGGGGTAARIQALRASLALPFSLTPTTAAAAEDGAADEATPGAAAPAGGERAAGGEGGAPSLAAQQRRQREQRGEVRAAMEGLKQQQQQEQEQQGEEEEEGGEEQAQQERADGGEGEGVAEEGGAEGAAASRGGAGGVDGLGEYMPVSISERYGRPGAQKRQRAQQEAGGAGAGAGGRGRGGKRPRHAGQDALRQAWVELGLEAGASEEEEEEEEGGAAARRRKEDRHAAKRARAGAASGGPPAGGAAGAPAPTKGGFDAEAARRRFDVGISNPHAPAGQARQQGRRGWGERPDEQEASGSGRAAGGRGAGRGAGRGGRAGRGPPAGPGRGAGIRGTNTARDGSDVRARLPTGKFNPYASIAEGGGMRGGRRSAVHVRSGNRSASFGK
eukprot:scaffold12.g8044.t1